MNNLKTKWYQRPIWIIILLIFFFPVGLFLMWKYSNWNKVVKGIISAFFALAFVNVLFSPKAQLEQIELSISDHQNEYDINTDIELTALLYPENSTAALAYHSTGQSIKFSDSTLNTGSVEGNYEIYATADGITSNTLSIIVVDKEAREAEEKAAKEAEEKRLAEEKAAKEAEEKRFAEEKAAKEKLPKTIDDDIDIIFSESVQNDVTGNWRLARVSTPKEIQEYALEYYNTYFQSDDEIHVIVNFALKTTNGLSKINSDTLIISVYDYVDKEENDAKILFAGTPIATYEINIPTGEITEIPLEPEETEVSGDTPSANADIVSEPVNDTAADTPSEPAANSEMVWLSATGDKYHSIPNCGRMNPNKATQVTKSDAEARGKSPCSKCY